MKKRDAFDCRNKTVGIQAAFESFSVELNMKAIIDISPFGVKGIKYVR